MIDLFSYIQGAMEQQKALLARELHDELGGLLVGAVMDVAWAEQHASHEAPELREKLKRARQTLGTAIDLKRKIIEELRPTLLDNVGLFAALRWYVQTTCKSAGIECTVDVPSDERRFLPNIPIALFRIVQDALAVVMARQPAPAAFNLRLNGNALIIELESTADIFADSGGAADSVGALASSHSLATLEQRVSSLGGQFAQVPTGTHGTRISATFPLDTTLGIGGDPQRASP